MSWVWNLLSNIPLKSNVRTPRSAVTEFRAEDSNTLRQAVEDIRDIIRTASLVDIGATALSSFGEVRRRIRSGVEELSRNGLGWRRTLHSVNVSEYGAKPWDPSFDNGPAFTAAFEAMVAAGEDGYLETDPGTAYWFQTPYIHGRQWINPEDVYAKCPAYDTAPSYDSAAYSAARALPRIGFKGNGAILVADLDRTGSPQALFSCFIGESHAKANQDQFEISGLHFVGADEMDGITPDFVGDPGVPLEADNNMVGFFSVLTPVKLRGCSTRAFKRGAVLAECYSATRIDMTASHCGNGLEYLGDNGSVTIGNKASLCQEHGMVATGQAPTHIGFISEQNAVAVLIPSCDGITFIGGYDENTHSGHTDFRVQLGEVADVNTAQAIKVQFVGWHMFGQYGKPIRFRSSPYARITNCRSYTLGSVMYDDNSAVLIDGYPMDFAAGSYNHNVTQFCPGAPGGTLQLGGLAGADSLTLLTNRRLGLGNGNHLYGDGSGNAVFTGALATLGNFQVFGTLFSINGQFAGPGGTTPMTFAAGVNSGQTGFDFLASSSSMTAGKIGKFRHGAGEKSYINHNGRYSGPVGNADSFSGTATLVGGTVTIPTTAVTATTPILYARSVAGGTLGELRISAQTAGSFTVTSSSATETSTINWFVTGE